CRFETYIATSAWRSRSFASRASPGASAMPMLTPTSIAIPRASIGVRRLSPMRATIASSVARESTFASTIVNSSPPIRQMNALSAAAAKRRDLAQHVVADVVAERVVDLLEAAEIEHQ